MKKIIILGLLVVSAVAVVIWGQGKNPASDSVLSAVPEQKKEIERKAWVEVVTPLASEIATGTSLVLRQLATGDELDAGSTISVGPSGLANIYFPDGSVVRLDKNTVVTLESSRFDEETESVAIRLSLGLGKIWAKVVSVATPDSVWEVETNNTVVTVRGTAFGVEYSSLSGKSTVIGSEGKVAARRIVKAGSVTSASSTPVIAKSDEVIVTADTYIDIEAPKQVSGGVKQAEPAPLVLHKIRDEIRYQEWVQNNKLQDQKIQQAIERIKEKAPEPENVRKAFRAEIREQFEEKIQLRRENIQRGNGTAPEIRAGSNVETNLVREVPVNKVPPADSALKPVVRTTAPVPVSPVKPAIQPVETVGVKPVSLRIKAGVQGKEFVEGDAISMQAFLVLSNGTERDVTQESEWRVVAPVSIGKMERPGLFRTALDPSLSEVGSGQGAIVASFKDPKTGEVFFNKSPIITVNAFVPPNNGEIAP